MSPSLEDYLETIYLLVQEHGFARVRDIARARDVKAATVSVALRKLAEVRLVDYERREYIGLTPRGDRAARRIVTRHRLLARFFEEVLKMPSAAASDQACLLEHGFSDQAMDRLVRFFEFLGNCPSVIETFRQCPIAVGREDDAGCTSVKDACSACSRKSGLASLSLVDLSPGQRAVVTRITATGPRRQRLLDMGILPDTMVDLENADPGGDPLWIVCQGARLPLRRSEASSIRVRARAHER